MKKFSKLSKFPKINVNGFISKKYTTASFFSHVKEGPPDPILGVTTKFLADKNPQKLNLGVGAYRDDNGKPFVLQCVKEAEKRIFESNVNQKKKKK